MLQTDGNFSSSYIAWCCVYKIPNLSSSCTCILFGDLPPGSCWCWVVIITQGPVPAERVIRECRIFTTRHRIKIYYNVQHHRGEFQVANLNIICQPSLRSAPGLPSMSRDYEFLTVPIFQGSFNSFTGATFHPPDPWLWTSEKSSVCSNSNVLLLLFAACLCITRGLKLLIILSICLFFAGTQKYSRSCQE